VVFLAGPPAECTLHDTKTSRYLHKLPIRKYGHWKQELYVYSAIALVLLLGVRYLYLMVSWQRGQRKVGGHVPVLEYFGCLASFYRRGSVEPHMLADERW
jgi:hypothetical protein